MENKKFLQLGLIWGIITIFCFIISLIVSLATNSWLLELSNLPLSPVEIFIIIFGAMTGVSGILSGVFVIIWILKRNT